LFNDLKKKNIPIPITKKTIPLSEIIEHIKRWLEKEKKY